MMTGALLKPILGLSRYGMSDAREVFLTRWGRWGVRIKGTGRSHGAVRRKG